MFAISDEMAVRRLSNRWTCPTCKRTYNMEFKPPAADQLCDLDRTELERRAEELSESRAATIALGEELETLRTERASAVEARRKAEAELEEAREAARAELATQESKASVELARVREEAWPQPADAEEVHEALFARFWGVSIGSLREVAFSEASYFFREYRDLLYQIPFQVQVDLLFTSRAVGLLAGMATYLDPDFDPWAETVPFAERLAAEELRGDWRGLAGRLLAHDLEARDSAGEVCALDTHTPRQIAFYERHGFEVVGRGEPAPGFPIVVMVREPHEPGSGDAPAGR